MDKALTGEDRFPTLGHNLFHFVVEFNLNLVKCWVVEGESKLHKKHKEQVVVLARSSCSILVLVTLKFVRILRPSSVLSADSMNGGVERKERKSNRKLARKRKHSQVKECVFLYFTASWMEWR